ncbi:MAG TPA: GlsB/YeaQ/YmgE family stress response membrane protein [Candidatus Woesebacteria bacterium]|nr:GlsB/YeaQ/YmgE family stress response membrane protein [Candidatus Woesebacteria bacterium]
MNILLWLLLGLVAGWLASVIMKTNSQQGSLTDIILGIVGAFVGGFLMNFFGQTGVTGFNIYSILVATLGAVVLIWLGRMLRQNA